MTEGIQGPHPGFGAFHILKTSLPFNWLQDAMSIFAVWFQDCIRPCYSSFPAVVTSHCKFQYLPVLQNPVELIHQMIPEVPTADLITDFNHNSAHRPFFACSILSLEKLHRVCCNMNLLADWLGKFKPKWQLGDAFHIDERNLSCCMAITVTSGLRWISYDKRQPTYPHLLDLTNFSETAFCQACGIYGVILSFVGTESAMFEWHIVYLIFQ